VNVNAPGAPPTTASAPPLAAAAARPRVPAIKGTPFALVVRSARARSGERIEAATPRAPAPVQRSVDRERGRNASAFATPAPRDANTKAAHHRRSEDDALDPIHRRQAALAPPPENASAWVPTLAAARLDTPASATADVHTRVSMEELLSSLVRKIAWSGDGRRGTVRIELGAGALAGGVLVIHADEGRVRVQLSAPSGVDASAWADRIRSRLAARQIHVEHVEVA
jgi:hypothetical protein